MTWHALGGAGYVVGLLAGIFWLAFDFMKPDFMPAWAYIGFLGGQGWIVGLTFWSVWRLQNRFRTQI